MRLREALEMLAPAGLAALGSTTWADLGAGEGTFTRALAALLAPGSVVHAMDLDGDALRSIRSAGETRIITHQGDFTQLPWPFGDLDGVLMANSLHYVREQEVFLRQCVMQMSRSQRFLIVEYDTDVANPWVPYPVSRRRLATLFGAASITVLSSRPSRYQRAELYSALVVSPSLGGRLD
jgi:ubiquinone/menaquinone biosynthesis C-methylase UbiE